MADPSRHTGRFAPSPTGELHLGSLRTALAAWLFARSEGAGFIVRVEDLDPDRLRPEMRQAQLDDLAALGIEWDGEPIWQSARFHIYRAAIDELAAQELTYPCFCTRADIRAAASAPHGDADGRYPGTCAQLAPTVSQMRADAGEEHCLRFRAEARTVSYDDALQGTVTTVVDDFVIRRKDGVPAYNLAVVIDDADQGIGQVVRGDDLASTTPRQLLLYEALGLPQPSFAHLPLVLGPDGARLAKRHGSVSLADLSQQGIPPDQVRTLLARSLGLTIDADTSNPADLVASFRPELIDPSPVVWDGTHLIPANRVP